MQEPSSLAVIHDFLARCAADIEAGIELSLERYRALFPGHEDLISREFARLVGDGDGGEAEDPGSLLRGQQLGPYRLRGVLGYGGQGVVYAAEDTRLGRNVALKLLSGRRLSSPEQLARFRREAETASRLDHPGICTVFEAGELDGMPFLAMQLLDGESLSDRIRRQRDNATSGDTSVRRQRVDECIALVEGAARAVQAAHERGIVHRDLKPGNVMVTADGRPVILDFGLAQDETSDDGLTLTGDLIGTPAYLPPERIRKEERANDPRADVYGLGAILFECLTGRPPFTAPTRDRLYRDIVAASVPDVRQWDALVPPDLQIVLEVALEKDPDRRYHSAEAFADDLGRVRRREPIAARRLPVSLLVRRWVQRHPAVSVSTAAICLLLGVGLAVALTLLASRNAALERARALALAGESARAEEFDSTLALLLARAADDSHSSRATVSQLYRATEGARQIAEFRHARTEEIVVAGLWTPDRGRLVTVGFDGLARIHRRDGGLVTELTHPGRLTRSADMHPDGVMFAMVSSDGTVRLWSVEDGRQLGKLEHETALSVQRFSARAESLVRFSPDGDLLVTGTLGGRVSIWNVATREHLWHADGPQGVTRVAWAPDGRRIIAGFADGEVRTWDVRDGRAVGEPIVMTGHTGSILAIAFSSDPSAERPFATAAEDGTVRLWSEDGECALTVEDLGPIATDVAFSPDGTLLLSAGINGRVEVRDLRSGEVSVDLVAHLEGTNFARFSPDGRFFATGGVDGVCKLVDLEGRSVRSLRGHKSMITDLRFLDGDTLFTTSWDGTARMWRVETGLVLPDGRLSSIAVGPDGSVVVAADTRLFVGSLERPFKRELFPAHDRRVHGVAFAMDGRLAAASHDGTVSIWDPVTGHRTRMKRVSDFAAYSVSFAGDGRLAVGHGEGVSVLGEGTTIRVLTGREVFGVDFSPDGSRIAAACGDGNVYLIENGETRVVGSHDQRVWNVAFSPDGRHLVSTSYDGTVGLWSLGDGASRIVQEHRGRAHAIAFTPDGKGFVTTAFDRTANIWNLDGTVWATLSGHGGAVMGVAFARDRILTVSSDATLRTWPATYAQLRRLADTRMVRGFTEAERQTYAHVLDKRGGDER